MQIRNVFNSNRDQATGYAQAAADFVSAATKRGKEKVIESKEKVLDYTTEHPARAIGISMLTGCVAGFLLKRKFDKDED
jgi:ElaB/YqjD/DUF883 family membrane-anchored ribosome-binding protein